MKKTILLLLTPLFFHYGLCQSSNLDKGLLLHFPFNGNALDVSGNNYHGNLHGGSFTTDKQSRSRSACQFDGRGEFFEFPAAVNPVADNWSFSLFFKLNTLPSARNDMFLLSYSDQPPSEDCLLYIDNDNRVKSFFKSSKLSSDVLIEPDKWYHAVLTHSPQKIEIYINGLLSGSTTTQQFSTISSKPFSIFHNPGHKAYGHGVIDEVRLYNRVLGGHEVSQIYQLQEGEQGLSEKGVDDEPSRMFSFANTRDKNLDMWEGLELYYPLNKDALDHSGNGNHAIVHGAVATTGRRGQTESGYYFDGNDDFLEMPYVLDLSQEAWTYSLFFKLADLPSARNDMYLLGYDQIPSSEDCYLYIDNDNSIKTFFKGSKLNSFTNIKKDQWYHVAISHSPEKTSLYINGLLKSSTTDQKFHLAANQNYVLFKDPGGKAFGHGSIDEIRFYSRVLNDDEILTLYSTPDPVGKKAPEIEPVTFTEKGIDAEKIMAPAYLTAHEVMYNDPNGNNIINAGETSEIRFRLKNEGEGLARDIRLSIHDGNRLQGLEFTSFKTLGEMVPGEEKEIVLPISGHLDLQDGMADFTIQMLESNGFDADPIHIKIPTQAFIPPQLSIVDHQLSSELSTTLRRGIPIYMNLAVQNLGQGVAEDVALTFLLPDNVFASSDDHFKIGTLTPGESRVIEFEFFANKRYEPTLIPIETKLVEKYGEYGESRSISVELNSKASIGTRITIQGTNEPPVYQDFEPLSLVAEVDRNIPVNPVVPNRFALIIGNEDYSSYQVNLGSESNVAYATNDAHIFSEYAKKTLGVESRNLYMLTNATSGLMNQHIDLLTKILNKAKDAELIFYYAGHGFPDEKSKVPYLVPVDVNVTNLDAAIKLSDIYDRFSQTGAKKVTIFLDACFSGDGRESGLLAARGVKIRPKSSQLSGNLVVFSASSGDQAALPFEEKNHGLFTYFLLKNLQENKGVTTYGDLEKYLHEQTSFESLRTNKKEQDPQVNVSPAIKEEWRHWRLW